MNPSSPGISICSICRITCILLEMLVCRRTEDILSLVYFKCLQTYLECGEIGICKYIFSSKESLNDLLSSSFLLLYAMQNSLFKVRSDSTVCRITYKFLSLIFSVIMPAYFTKFACTTHFQSIPQSHWNTYPNHL